MDYDKQIEEWAKKYGFDADSIHVNGYFESKTTMGRCRRMLGKYEITLNRKLLGHDCAL